jgi:hypothetical protein
MSATLTALPTEFELEELSQTFLACRTSDGFVDADDKLSALIRRYVCERRFDMLDQAAVIADDVEEDLQEDAQDLVIGLIEYHLTHRVIPANDQFPEQGATLMAVPLRLTPTLTGSLSSKVRTLENMLDFEDVGTIAGTLTETLKGRDARILMARKVYSAREIEEMGFTGLDSLASEMLEGYIGVRDEFESRDPTAEYDVTAFSAGDETDSDATIAVADVAGFAYLLFVYIDEPGYVPFSRDRLTDQEREASIALEEWLAQTRALIELRLDGRLDCHLDLAPAAFYSNYDSGREFWRYSQLHSHASTLLALSGATVDEVDVSLHVEFDDARLNGTVLCGEYDFSTWKEGEAFSVLVSFRRKGRPIGAVNVPALLNESPQDVVKLVTLAFKATGILDITAPSFD